MSPNTLYYAPFFFSCFADYFNAIPQVAPQIYSQPLGSKKAKVLNANYLKCT